ncbi:hypothetical protein ASC91_22720 [Pelomonas sp. Root1237]|nr:hypothetical protein ASC91_22720 [Pelomonas sp. Root1237]
MSQAQRQTGWHAQFGPQAQPAVAAAAASWVASDWQPQVQEAPGQLAQLQAGVVVFCMDSSVK